MQQAAAASCGSVFFDKIILHDVDPTRPVTHSVRLAPGDVVQAFWFSFHSWIVLGPAIGHDCVLNDVPQDTRDHKQAREYRRPAAKSRFGDNPQSCLFEPDDNRLRETK